LVLVFGTELAAILSAGVSVSCTVGPESRSRKRCIDLKARRYVGEQAYDAEGYIRVLSNYSGHRSLGPV